MEKRNFLGKMAISEVRNLIVKKPTTIKLNANMDELLKKVNEDLKTRHVYVVDDDNRLVGSVRMNSIVQYLFPMAAVLSSGVTSTTKLNVNLFSVKVADLMKQDPFSVKESTSLSKMAIIMIKEQINELPVVDEDMTLIGQVNVYEIIEAYKTINKER
ncbi:MAG: CBS domain-containing protein [Victivallaceae bacterium]|nr:CBS domain-containing protein [Victivallaceae bacterium]